MHQQEYDKLKEVLIQGAICSVVDAMIHIYANNEIQWLTPEDKIKVIEQLKKLSASLEDEVF